MQSLSGNENLKQIQYKYIHLMEQINQFKEGLDKDYSEDSFPIDCSLFFLKFKELDMEKIIKNYNENCNPEWKITEYGKDIDDRTITFPYKIIYDLTKNLTDKISEIILEIMNEVKDVSSILYVGGFSNSNYAIDLIKNKVNNKNPEIIHFLPPYPEKAILRGAIYYALSPERIKSRKAKYTLGMNGYMDWDEEKYGKKGKKIFDEDAQKYVCENTFYTFISKNEDLPYSKKVTRPFTLRKDKQDGTFGGQLIVYKSNNQKISYIDEEGVEEIGKMFITVENGNYKDKSFWATIELGGTFLNVIASHEESKTKCYMTFENIGN